MDILLDAGGGEVCSADSTEVMNDDDDQIHGVWKEGLSDVFLRSHDIEVTEIKVEFGYLSRSISVTK